MKKLLPFIFVLFFGFQVKAQMWCAPGATWHYRVYVAWPPIDYTDGHLELKVTNTVTINNTVCQNMDGVFKGVKNFPGAQTITANWVNFQTYENDKVVYIYNPESLSFDTIANFNANIGDKWLAIRFPFITCSTPSRPSLTVVDTGHVFINNIYLKKIKLASLPTSTYAITFIEKISNLSGFLFSYIGNNCQTDGHGYGNFVCYRDDNFPVYNPGAVVCDYVPTGVGVSENSITNSTLKLYPNPTNGIFNMELIEPVSLKIYSVTGALVYEKVFNEIGNFQLDISQLPNGIYNLRTESSREVSNTKLIKN
ncbi:MAG: T9SS type A sorting domain-containing protein [Bacteroidota bacterium]|nr:T9SS type A sorting domain-containing protein [Bacteroidota bacterium]